MAAVRVLPMRVVLAVGALLGRAFYTFDGPHRRLAAAGLPTVRDGVRWHLIERTAGVYDFASLLPMLEAARAADVEVIWDVLHYGWPDDLDVFDDAFIGRFARFAGAFAEVASRSLDGPLWVVPVNEISLAVHPLSSASRTSPGEHASIPRLPSARANPSTAGSRCALIARRSTNGTPIASKAPSSARASPRK